MERAIQRMFVRDVAVVLGFVAFLWVTMCFIVLSVLRVVGSAQTRGIIIVTWVAALVFATLSLFALIAHLRRRREVYVEELTQCATGSGAEAAETGSEEAVPAEAPGHQSSAFVKVFDVLFIMVLCFATLLGTMLLRGETVSHTDIYSIGVGSALLTVVGFVVYFVYILVNSGKELKIMVNELYPDEPAEGEAVSAGGRSA